MYLFLGRIFFFLFSVKWCWEVFQRFGKDVARLGESDAFAERFAIVLIWVLTLFFLAYVILFILGLMGLGWSIFRLWGAAT